jgi:NTP pyrophosphatase (non-canonical NTP hydrolase)
MEIKTAQKNVDDWVSQYKIKYFPTFAMIASIAEELGEVSKVLLTQEGIKPKKKTDRAELDLEDELGDLFFDIICLANAKGIDLEKAFERKMQKCTGRDKDRWERATK